MPTGTGINVIHIHNEGCDNDCPLREGEDVGREYE